MTSKEMKNSVTGENLSEKQLSSTSHEHHLRMSELFGSLFHGIVECSHKFLGMDNNHFIDEDKKNTVEKYAKIKSELSELKELSLESLHHLKEYKRKLKQLSLLEVQVKLAQIKQNKKKCSKFWKQHH